MHIDGGIPINPSSLHDSDPKASVNSFLSQIGPYIEGLLADSTRGDASGAATAQYAALGAVQLLHSFIIPLVGSQGQALSSMFDQIEDQITQFISLPFSNQPRQLSLLLNNISSAINTVKESISNLNITPSAYNSSLQSVISGFLYNTQSLVQTPPANFGPNDIGKANELGGWSRALDFFPEINAFDTSGSGETGGFAVMSGNFWGLGTEITNFINDSQANQVYDLQAMSSELSQLALQTTNIAHYGGGQPWYPS